MPHAQPPRFAFTTRLAFKEASNVAELLLIREPERRFYRECLLAGFGVAVYDESSSERIREQAANSEGIREQVGQKDKRADKEFVLLGAN